MSVTTSRGAGSSLFSTVAGASRYGLSSPSVSTTGLLSGRVPRPRRGGRRRSFMQLLLFRVKARGHARRVRVLLERSAIASSRDCEIASHMQKAEWLRRHGRNADVTDCTTRFGSEPATSAGAELSRGDRRHSCTGAAPLPCSWSRDGWTTGVPRIFARLVGRVTRSEPPNASSIATKRHSRNPPPAIPDPDSCGAHTSTRGPARQDDRATTVSRWDCRALRCRACAREARGAAPAPECGSRRHDAHPQAARARAAAPQRATR